MPKFRKKPVVIEAWQWNGEKAGEMPGICQCDSNTFPHLHTAHENTIDDRGQLVFLTKGDWIIPEAKKEGRYYPCKPDVFAETYEPASPPIMAELTPDLEGVLRQEMGRPGLIIYGFTSGATSMPKQQPWLISMEYNSVFARGNDGGTSRVAGKTIMLIDVPPWKYIAEHKLRAMQEQREPYAKNGARLSDEILAVYWAVQIPTNGLTEEEVDVLS